MKIAIVDDRIEELNRLLSFTEEFLPQATSFSFQTGQDFLDSWQPGAYDLILLDIFIGDMLGIDIARKIREDDLDVRLVFCTTSNEFACESYEVGANYYLHKPISAASFGRMLEMIRLTQYEQNRFIRLPDGQRVVLRNVIYSEYHNHLITIYMKRNEQIQTRLSQTEWEALLAPYNYYYSCSKGIVVNFHEIAQKEDFAFILSNGQSVPISRRKAKDTLNAYAQFRFEAMRKEHM